jgi:pimeloyl-ACP methyl ester carboxylesterase
MTQFTHDTAPTQHAEGGGIRFAYRRFGIPGRPPLVFFQHFMGTLDDHDPALSDAFASDREVILFDNTGVGSSSGTVPGTGPRGGEGIGELPAWVAELFTRKYERQEDMWLPILFAPSTTSQYAHIKGLRLPVLVVNGSNDIVIPTINSYILRQFLPSAELILYPDASHGAHFQYPQLFARHARIFLDD